MSVNCYEHLPDLLLNENTIGFIQNLIFTTPYLKFKRLKGVGG